MDTHPRFTALAVVIIIALLALPLFSFNALIGFALALIIIATDSVLEMHKTFTWGIPIDFEILTVGVVYLASHNHFFPALLVLLFGPLTAELVRKYPSRAAIFKPISLLPVLFLAPVFGPSSMGMLLSMLVGCVLAYIRSALTAQFHPFYSVLPRVTQFLLATYIIFAIIPLFQ